MGNLKAAIFDISDTTLDSNNQLQPGMENVIQQFQAWGIEIFFGSNNYEDCLNLKRVLPVADSKLLWKERVGGAKGRGKFVEYVCSALGIQPHNLIYLGDGKTDMTETVNEDVILFLAKWVDTRLPYGIPVDSPEIFLNMIQMFFLKDALWYFWLESVDNLDRHVVTRALLDPDIPKERGITTFLKTKGQSGPQQVNGYHTATYLSLHLIASIYLEGLHRRAGRKASVWCIYPSSNSSYTNSLSAFSFFISRLFNDRYYRDLIVRHTPAVKSSSARYQGKQVDIDNQLRSIHLNPAYATKIVDKNVIVIDDFTTYSHAFETSRNLLLNAGARSVMGIAVGKYGFDYNARSPVEGISWDSFAPNELTSGDFSERHLQGQIDTAALKYF